MESGEGIDAAAVGFLTLRSMDFLSDCIAYRPSPVAVRTPNGPDFVLTGVSGRIRRRPRPPRRQRDHLSLIQGSKRLWGAREMKQKDLRTLIVREWDSWLQNQAITPGSATGRDSLKFYFDLQDRRSTLLDFQSRGRDKWQIVHAWLLSERRVLD